MEGLVKLDIFNISGQKINTLLAGNLPAGVHSVRWDGKDSRGREVSTGIYVYQIKTESFSKSNRMIMIK